MWRWVSVTHTHTHTHTHTLIAKSVARSFTGRLLFELGNVLELLIRQNDPTTPVGLKPRRNQCFLYPPDHPLKHSHIFPISNTEPSPTCCASNRYAYLKSDGHAFMYSYPPSVDHNECLSQLTKNYNSVWLYSLSTLPSFLLPIFCSHTSKSVGLIPMENRFLYSKSNQVPPLFSPPHSREQR